MSLKTPEIPLESVVAWRRHLHAHPELSFKEFETAEYLMTTLQKLGVEASKPTATSVLGVIQGTADIPDPTRAIALRADTDGSRFRRKRTCRLHPKCPVSCTPAATIRTRRCCSALQRFWSRIGTSSVAP